MRDNTAQGLRPLCTTPSQALLPLCFRFDHAHGWPQIFCAPGSLRSEGYTHGVVVFNSVHAVAALAGVSLRDLVRDRHARLLWAAMIREGLQVRAPQLEGLISCLES